MPIVSVSRRNFNTTAAVTNVAPATAGGIGRGNQPIPSGVSFDPSALSGLQGWWRADNITSPPADGATLTTWTDSSSAARNLTQATAGSRPTYRTTGSFLPNGKPVVEFTAASATRLASTSTSTNGAITRFVVLRSKTMPSTGNITIPFYAPGGHTAAVEYGGRFSTAVDGQTWMYRGSTVMSTGQWYILTATDTTNNHITYVNAAQDGHLTSGHGTPTSTTLVMGAFSDGTAPFDGYIAEVVDYNRVLTSTERGQIHSYLAGKYGITLPTGPFVIQSFDFDTGDISQWTLGPGALEAAAAHQSLLSTTVRRGTSGYSHRHEVHNDPGDLLNGNTWRSLLGRYDTQEGWVGGPLDFAYGFSFQVPTESGATGSQTAMINSVQFWELHHRANIYNHGGGLVLAPHALIMANGTLYYRLMAGSGNWDGSQWTGWANYQDGIVILTGMQMNTWYDVVVRIKCAEDSTGITQVWARQAGQSFTTTPQWENLGPSMQYLPGGLDPSVPTKISAMTDIDGDGFGGMYLQAGLYIGSFPTTTYPATENSPIMIYLDEIRRYNTAADAMAAFPP